MNKLIIALSLACASAYAFADVGATPITKTIQWFNAVANPKAITGGEFNTEPSVVDGKFVIDSALTTPVTFTPTNSVAQNMATVNFTLDTAIVPADARADLSQTGAKVAFAASEDGYYAWLGSEWTKLGGAPKTEGVSYDLEVAFKGAQVKFAVDDVDLGTGWYTYSSGAVPSAMAIDFVGSGNVTSFAGSQQTITAEIVVVDGGVITIKEEDMEKFRATAPQGTSVDAFIASNAQTAFGSDKFATANVSVGAAYALGLVADDGTGKMAPVDGGVLVAKALAEANVAGVKLGLKVTPPEGTGATITYNILKNNVTYQSGLSQTDFDSFVIPTKDLGAGLKVFKVQAVVTPAAE